MTILPHSIRWRIQIWHGALLLGVLAGLGIAAYRLQYTEKLRGLDSELQIRLGALHGVLGRGENGGPPPGSRGGRRDEPYSPREQGGAWKEGMSGRDASEFRPPPPPPPPNGRPAEPPGPGNFRMPADLASLFQPPFYFEIWTRNHEVLGSSPETPSGVLMPSHSGESPVPHSRAGMREFYQFTPPGECLLVGASEAGIDREMRQFGLELLALGCAVLAAGLAGGWWMASRAIAPIAQISASAARIAGGRLSERIAVHDAESELGQLAAVLNSTFSRLEDAFAEQARFTSDAAHELRTPTAIILAQTQLALARPRSVEELRDTVAIVRRAAKRVQGLIESLLTLARLDAHSEPLERQPCDLAALAREQLDLIRPLADERGVSLGSELGDSMCSADPDRIAQIVTNLLANAVKYSRPGDSVRLTTSRDNGHILLCVADTGPGIAPEHHGRLFERFYRADASRNRSTGGAGLGLAICKTIAEAHGGSIAVESGLEQGSRFTLRIPAL